MIPAPGISGAVCLREMDPASGSRQEGSGRNVRIVFIICSEMSTPYTLTDRAHRSRRSVNPKPQPASSTVAPRGSARPKSRERHEVPLAAHRIGGLPKIPAVPIEPGVVLGGIRLEGTLPKMIERLNFAHGPTRLTQSWPNPTSVIPHAAPPGERRALAIRLERGNGLDKWARGCSGDAKSVAEVALLGMIDSGLSGPRVGAPRIREMQWVRSRGLAATHHRRAAAGGARLGGANSNSPGLPVVGLAAAAFARVPAAGYIAFPPRVGTAVDMLALPEVGVSSLQFVPAKSCCGSHSDLAVPARRESPCVEQLGLERASPPRSFSAAVVGGVAVGC